MRKSGCYAIETGIESLSDKVLNIINKGITKQRILELNRLFGKHKILLSCNFVVGFPGEGRAEFINTKKILADLPISYFHVFTYSDRPGTSSIKMKDKVDFHDKKERNRILIEQGKRKKYAFYENYLGREMDVLFEQKNSTGNWSGYTSNYMSVELKSDEEMHNIIQTVQLIENKGDSLIGVLI